MKQNSELRAIAREKLEGNWGDAALVTLVYMAIACVLGYAFQFGTNTISNHFAAQQGSSFLGTMLTLPIAYAYTVSILRFVRGEKMTVQALLQHYNGRVFATMLIKYLYVVLWMLLFIVPGIIKSYSYAMTEYIMNDNPELERNAAIEASMRMMEGHKMRLFLLDLSFIGWAILSILTFGLGFILLNPYINAAHAEFYEDLKGEINN